jgi:hypothetical protein
MPSMGHRLRIANPRRVTRSSSRARNARARIEGRHDLESLSLELQRFVARLQDMDVRAVERCSIYFTALDGSGGRCALILEGRPIDAFDV